MHVQIHDQVTRENAHLLFPAQRDGGRVRHRAADDRGADLLTMDDLAGWSRVRDAEACPRR